MQSCMDMPTPGGDDPPVSASGFNPQQVDRCCDQAEERLDELFLLIAVQMETAIGQVEETTRHLTALIEGQITAIADKAQEVSAKCQQKIQRCMEGDLSNCYAAIYQCGFLIPTNEDVLYGLETGDFLGSVSRRLRSEEPERPININIDLPDDGGVLPPREGGGLGQAGQAVADANVEVISTETPEEESTPPTEPTEPQCDYPGGRPKGYFSERGLPYVEGPDGCEYGILPGPTSTNTERTTIERIRDTIRAVPDAVRTAPATVSEAIRGEEPQVSRGGMFTDEPMPWGDPRVCEALERNLNPQFADGGTLAQALGWGQDSQGRPQMPEWFQPVFKAIPAPFDKMVYALINYPIRALSGILNELIGKANCDVSKLSIPSIMAVIGGLLTKYVSPEIGRYFRAYELTANHACPQEVPSQAEIDRSLLAQTISETDWKCLTKANNNRLYWQQMKLLAERSRPGVLDVLMLWRRGLISDAEKDARLRSEGVMKPTDQAAFEKLAIAFPVFDDVIRFIVRDVFNPQITQQYGYDDGFEANFQGEALNYARAQGITKELARNYWRAHWQIPSNTQLFEMLHRLRPGRVPGNVTTTADDVARMLRINDVLPWAVERLMAVSYRPMTRTDAQRAFMIGALPRNELKATYQDEGYNDRDAEHLTVFTERLKRQRAIRRLGLPSARELVNALSKSLISAAELRQQMKAQDYTDAEIDESISAANAKRHWRVQGIKIKRIKRKFLYGDISEQQAKYALSEIGVDEGQLANLVHEWRFSKESTEKGITAAKLCSLYEGGFITIEDYGRRLVGLGYSPKDAELLIKDCGMKADDKEYKAIMAELKAMDVRLRREVREARTRQLAADRKARQRDREALPMPRETVT